eukprot:scaffold10485_cov106-Skeletonema_dohrnii-CCMP3373.AAC.3
MERSANTKPATTEDEEDYAALIYQESQRRKAEAAALAVAAGKNKKKPYISKNGITRTSTRISATVAGDGSSTKRVAGGKAVHTRKRKASEGNDDEQAPKTKKVAKKQYQYSKLCSAADGCTNLAREGKVCCRHGAKVTLCRHDGCTNQVIKGGVCCRHGGKKLCSRDGCTNQVQRGVEKGAPIKLKEEVCAAVMEQRSNYAVETDVQIMLGREECAAGMEERNYAATKDAQNTIREVECAEDMEQRTNYTARNDVSLMSVREKCVGVVVVCFKRHSCHDAREADW